MQNEFAIKTFGNGDVLTGVPAKYGADDLKIDGKPATYLPLITPRRHPSGAVIVAVIECGGKRYSIAQETVDAMDALKAHYRPTLADRMSRIQQLEDVVRARRVTVGSARASAVEHMRTDGVGYSTKHAHAAEVKAVEDAEAALEAAKAADPEAWAAVKADREASVARAMND